MHDVLTRIMESGILADDPSLLASVESTMTRAEELLSAGKSLTALRKRLSIGEPGHELSAG
jgi:hypothetical protein